MLSLESVTKKYECGYVLKDFSLSFADGRITCLTGPSGVGKTTIINTAAGLISPDSGSVTTSKGLRFSYVFQEPRLLNWYTVYNNIDFVLRDIYKSGERREIIDKYLDITELRDSAMKKPPQLSGGMAQRVSIARAFAYPSDVLIMDEPFKGLDMKLKSEIMSSFKKLWLESRRTVIFITHDIDEAIELSDIIYVLMGPPAKIVSFYDNPTQADRKEIERVLKA